MRIGLVIGEFNPRRGGAELWTFHLAQRLIDRGHEVHVISAKFAERSKSLGIIPHCVQSAKTRLGFAEAVEAKLKTLALDVVHDQGMGWSCDVLTCHGGAWQASTAAKSRSLPRWLLPLKNLSLHMLPRYRTFRQLSARQFSDSNRIVIALSRMVANDFLRYQPIRPEQLRLVYNGTDIERFSPENRVTFRCSTRKDLGVPEDEVLFLFTGNDFHRKGLPAAVKAVHRLKDQGHKVGLLVVGGKPYRRIGYRFGIRDDLAVRFTGQVDDSVPYYAAADAFVLPTLYDPCSLSVLEAAASGLPCITTSLNGAGELMTEGLEGYVIDDPQDVQTLADRMERLLDFDRRHLMGAAARQLMLLHTLDRNCDELLSVYREVIEGRMQNRGNVEAYG